ncbi:hypothetical protein ES705_36804 [subsurface metagenome]
MSAGDQELWSIEGLDELRKRIAEIPELPERLRVWREQYPDYVLRLAADSCNLRMDTLLGLAVESIPLSKRARSETLAAVRRA